MKDRTEDVLSVIHDLNQDSSRQSVKSSEVAEHLELSTKQVAQEMRALYEEGYLGRFTQTTPTTWEMFPQGHPEVPENLHSGGSVTQSDASP